MNLKRIAKIVALLAIGSQIPSFVRGLRYGYNNPDEVNGKPFKDVVQLAREKRF